jgi:acetyl-CoA synthetase
MAEQTAIESFQSETRLFPPPFDFASKALLGNLDEYEKLLADAAEDPAAFWAKQAESLDWFKKWDTVLEWDEPHAKWFVGGRLNISYNCLDRHLDTVAKE